MGLFDVTVVTILIKLHERHKLKQFLTEWLVLTSPLCSVEISNLSNLSVPDEGY
jgi:uncharacterized protein YqiB (DUF1249 family)